MTATAYDLAVQEARALVGAVTPRGRLPVTLSPVLTSRGFTSYREDWDGGHVWFIWPDGYRMSRKKFRERGREVRLEKAVCAHCAAPRSRQCNSRADRHYCSNACRQAAYRARSDRPIRAL